MADGHPLTSDLVARIARANYANQQRVLELQGHEYPSAVPVKLLGLLQVFHAEIAITLSGLGSKPPPPKGAITTEDQETVLRRYGHLVNYLHSMLEVVDEARVEYVSQSAVILVQQLSQKLPDVKFLVIPQFEYNFSHYEVLESLRDIFRDAVRGAETNHDRVKQAIDSFGHSLAILRFPLAERNSILLNSMLAHEIGHAVVRHGHHVEPVIKGVQINQKTVDEMVRAVMQSMTPPGKQDVTLPEFFEREKVRTRLMDFISSTVAGWTEELLCDSMAFFTLGPAYLLSFSGFLLSLEGIDDVTPSHPPAWMRLKLLLQMMDRLGYTSTLSSYRGPGEDVFAAVLARLQEIDARVRPVHVPSEDNPFTVAETALEGLTEKIMEEARKATGLTYNPSQLVKDVPSMCEMLSFFVPPCVEYDVRAQEMRPANLTSILNAGVFFSIARMDSVYDLFGTSESQQRLEIDSKFEGIVSKAIELSHSLSQMRNIQPERG